MALEILHHAWIFLMGLQSLTIVRKALTVEAFPARDILFGNCQTVYLYSVIKASRRLAVPLGSVSSRNQSFFACLCLIQYGRRSATSRLRPRGPMQRRRSIPSYATSSHRRSR